MTGHAQKSLDELKSIAKDRIALSDHPIGDLDLCWIWTGAGGRPSRVTRTPPERSSKRPWRSTGGEREDYTWMRKASPRMTVTLDGRTMSINPAMLFLAEGTSAEQEARREAFLALDEAGRRARQLDVAGQRAEQAAAFERIRTLSPSNTCGNKACVHPDHQAVLPRKVKTSATATPSQPGEVHVPKGQDGAPDWKRAPFTYGDGEDASPAFVIGRHELIVWIMYRSPFTGMTDYTYGLEDEVRKAA